MTPSIIALEEGYSLMGMNFTKINEVNCCKVVVIGSGRDTTLQCVNLVLSTPVLINNLACLVPWVTFVQIMDSLLPYYVLLDMCVISID